MLFAGSGAFISDAPGADVIQLDKLGINEKLTGEGNKGFYAVVDFPSLAYGSDDNNVEFDGAFIENDLNYHIESDAEGECYIEVGGDRYDMDSNALSCLVYDYDLGKVIDTKSFDTMYRDEVYLPAVIDIEPLEGNKASILVRNVKNYDIWNVTVSIWDKDSSTEPISVELKQDDDDYNLFTGAADLAGIDTKNAFVEITCHDTSNMQHVYCDWNGDMGLLRSNLADYLAYVKSMKDCIILMSVHDEMGMSEDESVISALNRSGLKEFVAMADHEAYYAVIGPDGVTQAHSAEALTYEGTAGNTTYTISAAGWDAGYSSSIVVNDEEYCLGENGINIVVYNTKDQKIVDSTAYRFGIRGGDYKVFVR